MASDKILESKKARVNEIKEMVAGAASVILVDYKGINVTNDTTLRSELREANVEYVVIKNSLLRFAFGDSEFETFLSELTGSTAVAVSKEDPTAAVKVLQKYSDKLKAVFNLKAGTIDGKIMNAESLKAIASLPSRDVLVAQIAGSLNGIISSFARAVDEVRKQKEAA